jgi:hypothetical protein
MKLFRNKTIILSINKDTIQVGSVKNGKNPSFEEFKQYPYKDSNLPQVLSQIHKEWGASKIRVIISEDLAYVLSFPVDTKETDDRDYIEKKLKEYIPEVISDITWDYKHIQDFTIAISGVEKSVIQVIATQTKFIQKLSTAIKDSQLKAEAIEPLSVALARVLQNDPEPVAILYKDKTTTRLIAYRGLVLVSQVMNTEKLGENLKQLTRYAWEHFSIKPTKVYLAGDISEIPQEKIARITGLSVEQRDLNPMFGMATKKDLKGKDEDVLNIKPSSSDEVKQNSAAIIPGDTQTNSVANSSQGPLETLTHTQVIEPETVKDGGLSAKQVILTSFAIGIAGGIGAAIFMITSGILPNLFDTQNQPVIATTTPTATDSATLEATPSATPQPELKRSDIYIEIQNGSGLAGVAGELSSQLEELGYADIDSSNADAFDYEGITVKINPKIKSFWPTLESDLKEISSTNIETDELEEANPYDFVIIIGL